MPADGIPAAHSPRTETSARPVSKSSSKQEYMIPHPSKRPYRGYSGLSQSSSRLKSPTVALSTCFRSTQTPTLLLPPGDRDVSEGEGTSLVLGCHPDRLTPPASHRRGWRHGLFGFGDGWRFHPWFDLANRMVPLSGSNGEGCGASDARAGCRTCNYLTLTADRPIGRFPRRRPRHAHARQRDSRRLGGGAAPASHYGGNQQIFGFAPNICSLAPLMAKVHRGLREIGKIRT